MGGINSTFTQFIWFENYNDKKWAQKIWYSRHWNFHHEQSGLIKQCPLNLNAWQDFWPHEYFMCMYSLCHAVWKNLFSFPHVICFFGSKNLIFWFACENKYINIHLICVFWNKITHNSCSTLVMHFYFRMNKLKVKWKQHRFVDLVINCIDKLFEWVFQKEI